MLTEGRIGKLEINRDVRCHTAWDLVIRQHSNLVYPVRRPRASTSRLLRSLRRRARPLVQVLTDKRLQHGWKYGEHYFPHDIRVKQFTSGKSRLNTLGRNGH